MCFQVRLSLRVQKSQQITFVSVAMSQVASFVSGITLIGTSTEIYVYGTQYAFILAAPALMGAFLHFVIIPVFYDLKIVSIYEVSFCRPYHNDQTRFYLCKYLQRRFDIRVRLLGSLISSLSTILWLPIVIYVPALAFNQTTGVDVHIITPIVMMICVIYTCLVSKKKILWGINDF